MSNVFNRSLQQHRIDDRDIQRFVSRTIVRNGNVMGEARGERDQNDGFSLHHEMSLHDPSAKEPLAAFQVRLIAKKGQAEAPTSM